MQSELDAADIGLRAGCIPGPAAKGLFPGCLELLAGVGIPACAKQPVASLQNRVDPILFKLRDSAPFALVLRNRIRLCSHQREYEQATDQYSGRFQVQLRSLQSERSYKMNWDVDLGGTWVPPMDLSKICL